MMFRTTLVECITSVAKGHPTLKILICAPTNDAADLLIQKLSDTFTPSQCLRIMAHRRNPKAIPSDVLKYCQPFNEEERGFESVSLDTVHGRQIVVSTLCTASKLYNLGVEQDHFGMICVDEAGQAKVPEILAVVVPFYSPSCQLVLAGDPMQLGPVIRSDIAAKYGLADSYLDHVLRRSRYQIQREQFPTTSGFDPRLVTKLLKSYRSHPQIMEVSNRLFYDNELECVGDPGTTHSLANWSALPQSNFPVLFHGVDGVNQRESNSPSWFNSDEAELVLHYVERLCCSGVKPHEIGIITPYQKQSEKACTP